MTDCRRKTVTSCMRGPSRRLGGGLRPGASASTSCSSPPTTGGNTGSRTPRRQPSAPSRAATGWCARTPRVGAGSAARRRGSRAGRPGSRGGCWRFPGRDAGLRDSRSWRPPARPSAAAHFLGAALHGHWPGQGSGPRQRSGLVGQGAHRLQFAGGLWVALTRASTASARGRCGMRRGTRLRQPLLMAAPSASAKRIGRSTHPSPAPAASMRGVRRARRCGRAQERVSRPADQ